METYEDALSEAVQRLIAHGEDRGTVTEQFFDRLRHERDLQVVLLGEALPDNAEQANHLIREQGIDAVHKLMNHAVKRLQSTHRTPE